MLTHKRVLLQVTSKFRPTEAMKELEAPEFGVVRTKSYVAGAECLPEVRGESGEDEVIFSLSMR